MASYDEAAILDNARGTIYCNKDGNHIWDTDDGYHWYYQGCCGRGAGKQLEKYDIVDYDDLDDPEAGTLFVDERGVGHCPLCGGELIAG